MNFQKIMIPYWKHRDLECYQRRVPRVNQSVNIQLSFSLKYLDKKMSVVEHVLPIKFFVFRRYLFGNLIGADTAFECKTYGTNKVHHRGALKTASMTL